MTLGKLIQAARKNKGMTQVELGSKLGVTGSMIGQWENDLRKPKTENIERLAEALDCTVFDLLPDNYHNSLKYGFEIGYSEREAEFREEVNFACDELQRRKDDPQYLRMLLSYENLNNEGQKRLIEYAEALAGTGNYTPAEPPEPIALYGKDGSVTKTKKPPQGNQAPHDGK